MKLIIVILDGLGDRTYRELKNKTPLEAANTPNLDFLAKNGKTGIMYPIKGIAPESDEAALALFGYNPYEVYTGRGPLEALGANVDFSEGDVVLRCNYALYKGNKITDVEYVPNKKELKDFETKLNKIKLDVDFKVVNTLGYRFVLILKGKKLSPKISNTHPAYQIIKNYVTSAKPRGKPLKLRKCKALDKSKSAKRTAKIVNDFVEKSKGVLGGNKIVITRGAGNRVPRLKKLERNWALLADTPVEMAIGKITGMAILGHPKSLKQAVKDVENALKKYDSLYLQIKETDHWSHRGKLIKKKEAIEEIDRGFVSKIMKLKDTLICITADHSTPCKIKAHSADPVPLLIYYNKIKPDRAEKFSEKACKKGIIGKIEGKDLMSVLKKEVS
ncbi:MAG: 2,3-bisphosphoglycerate-independent phosphoglycerate mutase [Candidatus Woesearchaeota archaeon]|nr:MAG: 2,3-bisphosphoglycerate-independent phosphoglycerate mutase [Candidatus Woesearchaeota archaeon]